jgi:hypothetical protein
MRKVKILLFTVVVMTSIAMAVGAFAQLEEEPCIAEEVVVN